MECDTLIHIAEEDDASNTTVCSAASSGGASENAKHLEPAAIGSGDEAQLVEEEDFNYDFLHDDEEWSDDEDEVAVPIGAHSRGTQFRSCAGKRDSTVSIFFSARSCGAKPADHVPQARAC